MKIITTEKKPIKSWCNEPEETAIAQAKNLANLPFAVSHIALMPDTHMGYGMPIGAILAAESAIIPNAVGADIGCGMIATNTGIKLESMPREKIIEIVELIKKAIPLGYSRNATECSRGLMPDFIGYAPVCESNFSVARRQMGTLGSGNHFIELQVSKAGEIWVMVHTGSRNTGKKVADAYNLKAEKWLEKTFTIVSPAWKLAFLHEESSDGQQYVNEMVWCMKYASTNRVVIMKKILEIMGINIETKQIINIAHNYAEKEEHFGKLVWVHRKGATKAEKGMLGIIPGSQGTKSYIVKGLGNRDSFNSCSHGAGRRMGRKEAMRILDINEEIKMLDDKKIIHGMESSEDLEEASSAYKNIDTVIAEQLDLIEPVEELSPIAVIKG